VTQCYFARKQWPTGFQLRYHTAISPRHPATAHSIPSRRDGGLGISRVRCERCLATAGPYSAICLPTRCTCGSNGSPSTHWLPSPPHAALRTACEPSLRRAAHSAFRAGGTAIALHRRYTRYCASGRNCWHRNICRPPHRLPLRAFHSPMPHYSPSRIR